jgi:hypothetical protein
MKSLAGIMIEWIKNGNSDWCSDHLIQHLEESTIPFLSSIRHVLSCLNATSMPLHNYQYMSKKLPHVFLRDTNEIQ